MSSDEPGRVEQPHGETIHSEWPPLWNSACAVFLRTNGIK